MWKNADVVGSVSRATGEDDMFRLAKLSLANRALIALVTVVIAFFGVYAMTNAKQALMPNIQLPIVVVQTSSPGNAPDVVDAQLSTPIESALQSIDIIDSTSSTSSTGSSVVTARFAFGTDTVAAEQKVQQAVNRISSLLPEGSDPIIATGSTDDIPVVQIAATSTTLSAVEIGERLEDGTTNTIEHIDGVAAATVVGAGSREVRIVPDDAALAERGLTTASITQALTTNGTVAGAGQVTEGDRDLSVRVGSKFTSIDDLNALPLLPVTTSASTASSATATLQETTLGEVATVSLEQQPVTSISRVNGDTAVTVQVTKRADGNTVDVSQQINEQLSDLQAQLGGDVQLTVIYDQAPFIEQSIESLSTEGLLGLGFAVIVILLFLMSVRSTIVTAISIPTSLLVTFIGIEFAGYSLNVLTLGALTIAIGRVVDDSIVVIENINRHLELERGESRQTIILHAVREVAGAVTASTLTTAAVFLPVGFVSGVVGELFKPFAFTVVIALAASLFVSLTIVPVLAYWFLRPKSRHSNAQNDPASVIELAEEPKTRLQRWYEPVLETTLHHPWTTLVSAVVVLAITLALTPLLETNFIGDSGENSASVSQTLPSGTTLEAASAQAQKVEDAVSAVPGVETVTATIGTAGRLTTSSFLGGAEASATFQIAFDSDRDAEQVQTDLRAALDSLTDAGDLSLTMGDSSGVSSNVELDIQAPDDERLRQATDDLTTRLSDLDEVAAVESDLTSTIDTVHVDVDRAQAAAHGITETQIVSTLAQLLDPSQVAEVTLDEQNVAVVVRSDDQPTTIDQLRDVDITTPTGVVKLADLASVDQQQVAASIHSIRGQRSATITVTPVGDDLTSVSNAVSEVTDDVQLPDGVSVSTGGVLADQSDAFYSLGLALLAAILIVYVIMVATFRSLRQPLLLLISIPFAATGALLLQLIAGVPLGAASLVGVLMLIGIVVTNAIVLIDLVNQFRARGVPVREAVVEGSSRRLRPILMTAAATVFALVPMAIGMTGHAGFISQPLALVVIGGLVSSTVLTLLVLPVLYFVVEGRSERRASRKALGESKEAVDE